MSNYFNRILERHAAPAILPRVRSRFEPLANSEPELDELMLEQDAPPSLARPPIMRASAGAPLPQAAVLHARAPIPTAPERTPTPEAAAETTASDPITTTHQYPLGPPEAARGRQERVSIAPPEQARTFDLIEPIDPIAIDAGDDPGAVQAFLVEAPSASSHAPRRGSTPIAARRAPMMTPEAPQPIVRVTIGRLEIRAVSNARPENPKPRAKTTTPPLLTLEQYASERKRRGGQ